MGFFCFFFAKIEGAGGGWGALGLSAPRHDLVAIAWLVLTGAGSVHSDRSQPGLSQRLQLSRLPSRGGSCKQNTVDFYLDVRVCPFLDWGARGAPCSAWCWGGPAGPWLWVRPEGVGSGRCLAFVLQCRPCLTSWPWTIGTPTCWGSREGPWCPGPQLGRGQGSSEGTGHVCPLPKMLL